MFIGCHLTSSESSSASSQIPVGKLLNKVHSAFEGSIKFISLKVVIYKLQSLMKLCENPLIKLICNLIGRKFNDFKLFQANLPHYFIIRIVFKVIFIEELSDCSQGERMSYNQNSLSLMLL